MARRNDPEPKQPTISKNEGKKRLTLMSKRGEQLLATRPLKEGQEDIWSESCLQVIRDTFGEESSHQNTFIGPIRVIYSGSDHYDRSAEKRDAEHIARRCTVLDGLVQQLDLEAAFDLPVMNNVAEFWNDLHPTVTKVAKPRFDAGQFADSVEASLKEVNAMVKEFVKGKSDRELDGAALMQVAFSPNAPIITLEPLDTESGKNIQQGYMQIFSGAMTGIRNPKAHANIIIDARRAKHHLHLASLLAFCFDERQP